MKTSESLPKLPEPEILNIGRGPMFTEGQMREYGRLCRATAEQAGKVEGDYVTVPREIVANYRESTHIPRHRRICDEALAKPTQPAATQMPVAWYAPSIKDTCTAAKKAQREKYRPWEASVFTVPLYAAPVTPSREVEALVEVAVDVQDAEWFPELPAPCMEALVYLGPNHGSHFKPLGRGQDNTGTAEYSAEQMIEYGRKFSARDRDAYEGSREDLLDWKRRAQKAEAELLRLGYIGGKVEAQCDKWERGNTTERAFAEALRAVLAPVQEKAP